MDWFDLPELQGNLKSLLQHHSSKASVLLCSAFFIVQLSYPYMTTRKTIALTRWTFVDKVMSLLFNVLSMQDFPGGSDGKVSVYSAGDLGWKDPLEKEMAIQSSILAWRIPMDREAGLLWGHKESDMTEQLSTYI